MTNATPSQTDAAPSDDVLALEGFSGPQEPAGPGFALVDDCDGRFVIDASTGFISVASEAIVAREHGQTHTARMRVVESNGDSYEMDVRLVITGLVPQLAGEEGFGSFALDEPAPAAAPMQKPAIAEAAEPAPAPDFAPEPAPEPLPAPAPEPVIAAPAPAQSAALLPFTQHRWTTFSAFAARAPQHRQRGRLAHAPFGIFSYAAPNGLECPQTSLTLAKPAFDYPG